MKRHQKDFLLHLLESDAIKFGEFRLKSGRVSPYFVNIAVAINTGRRASETADAYVAEIVDGAVGTDFDYIHGPAYKGIPLSVLIAEKLWGISRGQGASGSEIDLRGAMTGRKRSGTGIRQRQGSLVTSGTGILS